MEFFKKQQEAILEGHTNWVNSLAVTNDNKFILSGSDDNIIRVWNLLEKRQEDIFESDTSLVNSVAKTKDNKYVVSGSDDYTVRVWNLLDGHTSEVKRIIITNSNQYYSITKEDLIIWSLDERKPLMKSPFYKIEIFS